MGNLIDLAGKNCGSLEVKQRKGTDNHGQALWLCLCVCGKLCTRRSSDLRTRERHTCGCRTGTRHAASLTVLHQNNIKTTAPRNYVLAQYRQSARSRGYEFSLKAEVFNALIAGDCFWCGAEPSNFYKSEGGKELRYSGIDRRGSSRGYVEGNCVSCCKLCNYAKNTMSEEEFLLWIDRVYKHLHAAPEPTRPAIVFQDSSASASKLQDL